jgi:GT2 family glycosyltransferase
LKLHPYDSSLITSDDSELNFRLIRLGFKFIYEPSAKVFHHSECSIKQFMKHMFAYGENISRVIRKHKAIPRWYALIPSFFVLTMLFGFFLSFINKTILFLYLILIAVYIMFLFYSALKIVISRKSALGFYAFILAPLQHVFYGLGVFYGIFINIKMKDWRIKWNYK